MVTHMARPTHPTSTPDLATAARLLVDGACASTVGEHIDLWNNFVQALVNHEATHRKRYVAPAGDEE